MGNSNTKKKGQSTSDVPNHHDVRSVKRKSKRDKHKGSRHPPDSRTSEPLQQTTITSTPFDKTSEKKYLPQERKDVEQQQQRQQLQHQQQFHQKQQQEEQLQHTQQKQQEELLQQKQQEQEEQLQQQQQVQEQKLQQEQRHSQQQQLQQEGQQKQQQQRQSKQLPPNKDVKELSIPMKEAQGVSFPDVIHHQYITSPSGDVSPMQTIQSAQSQLDTENKRTLHITPYSEQREQERLLEHILSGNPIENNDILHPEQIGRSKMQKSTIQESTIQHSTAQHSTIQASTLQDNPTHPITIQSRQIQPSTIQPSNIQPSTIQHSTIQPITIQSTTIQRNTIQPSTMQFKTIQSSTIQPSTIQPSTVQLSAIHAPLKQMQPSMNVKGRDAPYVTFEKMTTQHFLYRMDNPRRGVAMIFNTGEFQPQTGMKRRNGYEVDGKLMEATFSKLGFTVHYHKNKTTKQMMQLLNQMSDDPHGDADCFVCVIMTHGNRSTSDLVFTKDGMLYLDFIIDRFNGQNCPSLVGKPKLFFIQACRGEKLDPGQDVPYADEDFDEVDACSKTRKIPVEADILLSQATTPGYISFRNSALGSIYIRSLTRALDRYGHTEDILTVLTRVNAMVAFEFESNSSSQPQYSEKKQMPVFTSQLTKRLIFSAPPDNLK